jgi:hypothetical protein
MISSPRVFESLWSTAECVYRDSDVRYGSIINGQRFADRSPWTLDGGSNHWNIFPIAAAVDFFYLSYRTGTIVDKHMLTFSERSLRRFRLEHSYCVG